MGTNGKISKTIKITTLINLTTIVVIVTIKWFKINVTYKEGFYKLIDN